MVTLTTKGTPTLILLIIQHKQFAKVVKRFSEIPCFKNSITTQNSPVNLRKWSLTGSGLVFSKHPLSRAIQS